MSETCCTRVAGNAGRKNDAKNRHLGTIAQLGHVSTIGKKLVKQQYLGPYMSSHYTVNFGPPAAEIGLASLGHPCKFQRLLRLGSFTARQSSSGRQPNFAALNRGGHHVGHWPTILVITRMWANAQPDGRPAEYR